MAALHRSPGGGRVGFWPAACGIAELEWVFAYGSLIWRPGFEYLARRRAWVQGWSRRFWQGSPDHRGTEESPGRVVTLVPAAGDVCHGFAYRLAPSQMHRILTRLDAREQGGYSRRNLPTVIDGIGQVAAVTWIAGADNPHFLGPETDVEIARHIYRAAGPSGSNLDYFTALRGALNEIEISEEHIDQIACWIERLDADM